MQEARIYLSGRGYGDYSPVEWRGDLTRPDAEIIAECRALLDAANEVDESQTEEQLIAKITEARRAIANRQGREQTALDGIAALQAEAVRTGKPQVVRRWMTDRCRRRYDDCSFDAAVETIDGPGHHKTTYTCCC